MGTCQAELCACRAAGINVSLLKVAKHRQSIIQLSSFMEERWRGIEPIAYDAVRRSRISLDLLQLLGLNTVQPLTEQVQKGTDSNEF